MEGENATQVDEKLSIRFVLSPSLGRESFHSIYSILRKQTWDGREESNGKRTTISSKHYTIASRDAYTL
jgi:hypothetical protein